MDRRPSSVAVCAAAILLTFSATTLAQAPSSLPAGATPGGSRLFPGRTLESQELLAQRSDLQIPPLVERPLGLEEGPRVRVANFKLEGVEDRPANDVSAAAINVLLQQKLAAQPADGFTINQLQAVADDITSYYRTRGLILAQAMVPAQNVQGGVVTLRVLEGVLSSVAVEGNKLYSTKRILGPFKTLMNSAVDQSDVEQAILNLQDLPGLTVFGTFRQGAALGQTELLVSVRNEDRFYVRPSIDNYGSDVTGDVRATLDWGVNDLIGAADRLSGYLVQTKSPDDGQYYGFQYQIASTNTRNTFGIGTLRNRFDATPASTGLAFLIHGEVQQSDLSLQHRFANRRSFRADFLLDLASKKATTDFLGREQRDDLKVLSYAFNYYAVGRGQRGINLGTFRLTGGENRADQTQVSRQGGSGAFAVGNYSKLEYNYQRLQRLGNHHALLFRLEGQKSDDLLVSLEQYSIGGPANVRAYPVAEALVDTGYAGSFEWIIDAPGFANGRFRERTWGDIFKLSFFRDYAGGEINDPRLSQTVSRFNLRGTGIGFLFNVSNKMYLRLDAARADTGPAANGDKTQHYLSFNYTF